MSAFPGDQVDEKPLAEDLQVLRAQGEMSKEEETAMNLRDQINRDILSQKKKEGGGGTKKTKKLSSKLSSSKAKTRELFEESRRETFMELNVPPSNHPSSMFPEPVVLEESSSSHRRTSRSGNKPRSKGRADPIITMKEEEDHSPLKQSHEDITEKLEAEHAKTVRKEKETEKETVRRRRREAREVAQPPEEAASSSPSSSGDATRPGDDPLLARLDPPAEHTDIDKALMAKEEGNDFFRSKNYDFACQQYAQAVKLCPREGTEGVGRGTGTHTTNGSGDDDSNKPQPSENADHLATFLGNRAAAFYMLGAWDQCETDCTLSLLFKPGYVKVLVRRCTCLEKQDKIEEALSDAVAVQQIDPTFPKIDDLVARLQKRHDVKMAELKDEAMGKLKDLGNSILGSFGMSMDQFNFKQNPDGTWSMGS
jgi:hypothetical protein